MEVRVTWKHINTGKQGSSLHCPIALALKEVDPAHHQWWVGAQMCGRAGYRARLPVTAQIWVRAFDQGLAVEPETFTIDKVMKTAPVYDYHIEGCGQYHRIGDACPEVK